VIPKSVTDKTSAALTSPAMMALGDSGSAGATPLSSSAAKADQGLRAPRPKPEAKLESSGLRCIVCGRCSCFVDPFPPSYFPKQKEV
jgi:hypothetical protein